ncbi:MAG: ABC transporter permease [Planctomycetes bacterium]|nr:ABC transporter permease [Planctomycetota bacterium]
MAETETPGILKRLFMNPLAVRELRVACRSWKLVIILTAYLLVQGAIFSIWLFVSSDSAGLYEDPTSIGSGLFTTLAVVLVIVVMLVFPAFSSTAIASEHERKSFDLLLLTPLAPWEIALGKFFAAGIQASIFLVATVPLFAMANLFGGIKPEVFFAILWMLVLLSLLISFLGVFASSLVTKSIPAVLVTYLFALFFGMILLTVFIILMVARTLAAATFPLVAFLTDPTLNEGIYYVTTLTVSCAIYCTFLFLSTTNRLKPTSHNKSTGLRLFWTAVAIVVPVQIGAYFLMSRLPSHDAALTTLIMSALYLGALLLVPALSAPAEAPVASRRVRREMSKLPQGLVKGGGAMFFPGGARGAAHSAMLVGVGMLLLAVAGWLTFGQLESRLDDVSMVAADYAQMMEVTSSRAGTGTAMTRLMSGGIEGVKQEVVTFYGHEYNGFLLMLVAIALTVLVTSQITWRISLSGLSKSLSGVLAALMLVVWLAVPWIGEQFSGNGSLEDQKFAQFSPIHACMTSIAHGKATGRIALVDPDRAKQYELRAERLNVRWWTFTGVTAALGLGLLGLNIVSHRKVMKLVAQATANAEQRHESMPPQVTQAALEQVLQQVTQPLPDQMPPGPPMQGPPMAGPPA